MDTKTKVSYSEVMKAIKNGFVTPLNSTSKAGSENTIKALTSRYVKEYGYLFKCHTTATEEAKKCAEFKVKCEVTAVRIHWSSAKALNDLAGSEIISAEKYNQLVRASLKDGRGNWLGGYYDSKITLHLACGEVAEYNHKIRLEKRNLIHEFRQKVEEQIEKHMMHCASSYR